MLSDSSLSGPNGFNEGDNIAGPSRPRPGLSSTELAQNLHNLISSKTPLSHPICVECITLFQSELQKELDELQKERDAYIAFEQGILRNREASQSVGRRGSDKGKGKGKVTAEVNHGTKGEGVLGEYDIEGTQEEWDALIKRKKELQEEEESLTRELEKREAELEGIRIEEQRVRMEEKAVEREEEESVCTHYQEIENLTSRFLLHHHALSTSLRNLRQTLSSAETHLLLSTSLLQHLESTNVYNDAFQIGYVPLSNRPDNPSLPHIGGSGYVGTINGLRLGGRPIVDWEEINAAWGLVALCVDRVAARVGYTFAK